MLDASTSIEENLLSQKGFYARLMQPTGRLESVSSSSLASGSVCNEPQRGGELQT